MNSDERLLQVLNNSRCLSKKQMLDYRKGSLFPEELRAVELHLSECVLCNYALEGFEQTHDAASLIDSLKIPLLPSISTIEKKQHHIDKVEKRTDTKDPENTDKRAQQKPLFSEKKELPKDYPIKGNNRNRIITGLGVAALLLIGFGLIWHFEQKDSFLPSPENTALLAAHTNVRDSDQQRPEKEVAAISPKKKEIANRISADTNYITENDKAKVTPKPIQEHATLEKEPIIAEAKKDQSLPTKPATEKETKQEKQIIISKKEEVVAVNAQDDAENKPKATTAQQTTNAANDKPTAKMQSSDYEIGVALFKKKQYASALLYLNTAESNKNDPHYWDAVYYSALCNKNLNKTGKAKRQFKQIIKAGVPQKSAAESQLSDLGSNDDE